jgi:hypothetical protein
MWKFDLLFAPPHGDNLAAAPPDSYTFPRIWKWIEFEEPKENAGKVSILR